MNEYRVLERPIFTERTAVLKEKNNQYVFKVSPQISKLDVKRAVEKIFKVSVEKVHTSTFQGKAKRVSMGGRLGRRSDWKKAIVTVKKGQEIKLDQDSTK